MKTSLPLPLPLALTQGDPSGIGPELTLKAFAARKERGLAPFFVLADPDHLARVGKDLAIGAAIEATTPDRAAQVFERALPVVPLGVDVAGAPGAPSAGDARATILSIERAVECAAKGEARAVVTNPIAKSVLYEAGFSHPGHTEFLGELAERFFLAGKSEPGGSRSNAPRTASLQARRPRPVMMLWAEELAVVPVTIHVALADVPRLLTRELLVETGAIAAADLQRRFGVAHPRLAFAGLNPHAGEGGAMGREEIDVIAPAIEELRARGIDATGPHPADTLFHAQARARYDVALCPTHDQALIPIKTLAFDRGVNVTLGLPFVRTSPDHGTAFDIAGKGVANPSSLIEALRLAARMTA